ncbi:MAG: hypothetical protein PVH17_03775 [Anaerolineae bacterium]
MPAAKLFQIGSFDVTKFSEDELWARMNSLARFYASLPVLTGASGTDSFRLLAYSRPYPLDAPLQAIKEMLAGAASPGERAQIVAYRRFLEEIVEAAYLKSTDYYLAVFSDKAAHILGNVLAGGLRVPVRQVEALPDVLPGRYREAAHHLYPARNGRDSLLPDWLHRLLFREDQPQRKRRYRYRPGHRLPYIALLYSYDLRGRVSLGTTIHFLSLPFPVYLAVDVKTIHPKRAIRTLTFAYNKLRADVVGRSGNEMPDPEKEQAYVDVQEAMRQFNDQRLGIHQVGLGLAILADTRKQLDERIEIVLSTAAREQIYLRRAWWHQWDAYHFFTPHPVPGAIARAYRNVLSPGVACLAAPGYEIRKDVGGILVAINRATGSPLWLDKFSLPAYNEVILGRTGSGKTFAAGLRAYRHRMKGVRSVIIDPQGNFEKLTRAVDGSYNRLRLGEGTALNILDIVHSHPAAQISHVMVMLEALLGRGLDVREKAAADRALLGLYDDHIRTDADLRDAGRMPLLEDLVEILWPMQGGQDLALDLERFVGGSLQSIFNAHTTLSFDLNPQYPIITFDVSDLEGEFQPALIYALLSGVERATRRGRRRTQQMPTDVILDEFFILSRIPTLAEAVGALAKRVRAWKVGIQCLDQNWGTFDTPAGRQILENTLVKTIMRVDDTAAPTIVEALGLTGHHAEVILSADVGEGVMIIENKPYHVFFQASRDEIKMLTPYVQAAEEALMPLPIRGRK